MTEDNTYFYSLLETNKPLVVYNGNCATGTFNIAFMQVTDGVVHESQYDWDYDAIWIINSIYEINICNLNN